MSTGQGTAYQNYIGGQWVNSVSGETYTIINPADKHQELGAFQRSVPEDVDKAIESSHEALASWSRDVRVSSSELRTARLELEEIKDGGPNSS